MFSRAGRQLARQGRKYSSQAKPRVNAATAGAGGGKGKVCRPEEPPDPGFGFQAERCLWMC